LTEEGLKPESTADVAARKAFKPMGADTNSDSYRFVEAVQEKVESKRKDGLVPFQFDGKLERT
jgi:hypothetical protein